MNLCHEAHVAFSLNAYQKLIESTLEALLLEYPQLPHHLLFESARYSLLSSGKRLRPLLTLATVQAFELPIEKALIPASALELIHTYSLIHDDLPCMDNDDWRRGKPSLHRAYPEGHALLTGDYLLTYAFELLSDAPLLSAEQKVALIQLLSKNAGGQGMIGGQVLDLISEGKAIDWPTLELMYMNKTAALITTALEFGAIIVEASSEDRAHLRTLGNHLGLAFQIIDDLLEEESPESSDQKKKKATAVTLLGRDKAKERAHSLSLAAHTSLASLSRPAPLLAHLTELLTHRKN